MSKVVVSRYAKSIFDVFLEESQIKSLENDLNILENLKDGKQFLTFMSSPIVSNSNKKQLVEELCEQSDITDLTLSCLIILIESRRINLLFQIIEKLMKMIDEYRSVLNVKITFGLEPSEEELSAIVESLKKRYKKETVKTELIVENRIISGFILEVGKERYDNSLLSEINSFVRTIKI